MLVQVKLGLYDLCMSGIHIRYHGNMYRKVDSSIFLANAVFKGLANNRRGPDLSNAVSE